MRRLASLLLATSLATLAPAPASALCALPRIQPILLTTGAGGAIVGTEVSSGSGKDRGEAMQPTWMVKVGTRSVKPVVVELAPGLVAYQLPDKVDAGELMDGRTVIAKLARAKPAKPLPAPAPIKVTYKLTPNIRGNMEQTVATFATDVPAEAIAVIVADAATGVPRSYRMVEPGSSLTIYGRGRCSALPNKTRPTVTGDKVVLRWVDKAGVVSPDSKPIVVEALAQTGPLGP